ASLLPRPAFPARPRAPRRARRPTGAASADPQGGASSPSISADGSRVSFNSDAANLVPADANTERTDPFVRDLELGATVLADARRSGRSPQRGARFRLGPGESLSADGRYAVFSSNTPDLAGRVRHYAIFRRDLSRRVTQRACRAGDGDSFNPVIAADGRHVAFESEAAHLAGSDQNQQIDVYWCDVATGELRRVSQPLVDGVSSSGTSTQPSISADGRYVAFASDAGGLAPGDEGRAGVYWRDMVTGETRVVDVPPGGSTSNGNGEHPRISADGRFVVFDSDATDLPGGELDGRTVDVFRKDMATGEVTLVSSAPGGANGDSTADSLSADGNLVAFTSSASNLVSGDSNGRADVFVRDVAAGTTTLVSRGPGGAPLPGPSSQGAISADGRFVAFASRAAGVFPQDTPTQRPRVYRRDLWTGELLPVTVGLDLAPTSVIGEPSGVSLRRKVRLIAGTAKDDGLVTRVDVAASRSVGRGRCLWLGRRGATVRRSCGRPLWLRAKVASGLRWTLRIGRLLPRGTWTVRSRATDDTGRVEKPRPGRNVTSFRLR
ncbi:MAG: PD40 domain-containing protein, partial [Thermoleophilaceae bacterium]|nr:PD40 domain-containing protein [Thermoleophilaceae bacterium]